MDAGRLHAQEAGLEQGLGAPEALVADGDHLSVGQLVALLQTGAGGGGLHLLLEVQGDVAQLLLDVTDDLMFGSGGERVTTFSEDLHQVVGQITSGQVQTEDGVGQSVTLVDGHGVGDTLTRVEYNTSDMARGVQREHGLDSNVQSRDVESLKHDLSHFLLVGLGIEWGLGQQHWVLLGDHKQFIVEGVMPDLSGGRGGRVNVSHITCMLVRTQT